MYSEQVLSKASRDQMFTLAKNNYGFGHGGGMNGFSTMISRFPDDDAVVIVLSNNAAGNAGAVAQSLAGTLIGAKVPLPGERVEVSVDPNIL